MIVLMFQKNEMWKWEKGMVLHDNNAHQKSFFFRKITQIINEHSFQSK